MATNLCSKTRTKYAPVKELAEELSVTAQQIYKILKEPAMEECIKRVGTAGIRIEKEKFYTILEQIYRK